MKTHYIQHLLQIPIRKRFLMGMLLMLLPIIILAATAIYSVDRSAGSLEKVVEKSTEEVLPIIRLQRMVLLAAMPPNDYLINADRSNYEEFRNISREIDSLFEEICNFRTESHELMTKARDEWESAKKISESILALPDPLADTNGKQEMLILDLTIERVVNILDGIVDPSYKQMGQQLKFSQKIKWNVYFTIVAVFGAGLLVAITTGMALAFSIIYPVRILQYGANQLGEGKLSYRISLKSKDELGQLASSFNAMAEKIEVSTSMLHELATHDGLTGLFNNREFYRRLRDEINRYKRFYHSFSMLLMDIDYFKSVNDNYGHQTGDTVLGIIASIIKESIRETDFAARYGGDEFAVILCDTSEEGALNLAERIRTKIETTPIKLKDERSINLTVSIGMASFSELIGSEEKFINIADRALYAAKETGRNKTFVSKEPGK